MQALFQKSALERHLIGPQHLHAGDDGGIFDRESRLFIVRRLLFGDGGQRFAKADTVRAACIQSVSSNVLMLSFFSTSNT